MKTTVTTFIFTLVFSVSLFAASANNVYDNELIGAVKKADFTQVVLQLDRGMNPNVVENHETPLMIAARAGDFKIARVLIAFGADVNMRSQDGTTALMLAARHGHNEVVTLLLENSADTSLRNSRGYTSFDLARMFNHTDTAAILKRNQVY